MDILKYRAGALFTGYEMLDGNKVLITESNGTIKEIIDHSDAGDDIITLPGILTPGFINCHCHLELSHMKGLIAEKTGLVDFVFKVVTQRHFNSDEIEQAVAMAEDEMLTKGIVAVGDICNNLLTLPQKLKSRLVYYNFIEASGWLPGVAGERFSRSKIYYNEFLKATDSTSIVPHAPYSVSHELWQYITPYFKNKTVTTHNQETAFEDELFRKGTGDFIRMYNLMNIDNSHFTPDGRSSLQNYFSRLSCAKNVILVHNSFTTLPDIKYANKKAEENKQQLFWCLCLKANLYIENAIPPVKALLHEGSKLVLGTDSLASNHTLSILDEMKAVRENYPSISTTDLLKWATINGAQALQMEDKLGSFEKGKQPGVLIINEKLTAVKRLV